MQIYSTKALYLLKLPGKTVWVEKVQWRLAVVWIKSVVQTGQPVLWLTGQLQGEALTTV